MCRQHAERQGWEFLEDLVYIDEDQSGSGADRPRWIRLLSATRRPPRPFDILLVENTSRLCRSLGESANFVDEMKFIGIRVVAVSQQIDTDNKQAKMLMVFHGMKDEMYIEELAPRLTLVLKVGRLRGLTLAVVVLDTTACPIPQ
jgi:DNA invertase Pin-like site-specific DNA recombinase